MSGARGTTGQYPRRNSHPQPGGAAPLDIRVSLCDNIAMRLNTWVALAFLAAAPACTRRPEVEISLVAATDTAGWAHDVRLDGDRLYVADRQGGFLVFERSSAWSRARVCAPVEDVISLAPHSGEPVLASRFEGLVLVSAEGRVTGRYSNGDIANAVVMRGDLAFAAYGLHGLVIVKVDEDGVQEVAQLVSPGWSHDVKLSREQALLADWNYGLRVVDIRDPLRPVEVGVLPSPATTISVAVRETGGKRIAALADGHAGVTLAELDDAGRPRLLGRNSLGLSPADAPHPESGGWAHSVAWGGQYVFVADWKRGLSVLDAGDPAHPRVVREIPTGGTALGVATEEQKNGDWLVFLADGEAGLKVYRFRDGHGTVTAIP